MRYRIFPVLFLLICCTFRPETGVAKSYTIPVIRIEVTVQPDGSIRITEHRTYSFENDFSWADYRLPLKGFTAIKDIRVTEQQQAFVNKNSGQPGSFQVQRGEDQVRIKWFYHAEDERRTFTLSYTLKGAIVMGPEWSEFFWNYISADRESDTDSLHISLELPQATSDDSLFVWNRSTGGDINLQTTTSGYTVTATNLDEDASVKIRSVFPRRVFNAEAVSTTDPNFSLADAREDAARYAQQQRQAARYADYGQQLAILISVLSIAAFLFFYRKYGKRFPVQVSESPTMLIPGKEEPAAAGWLLHGKNVSSAHIMATLLDLARRGHFIIREDEPEEGWFNSEQKKFRIEQTETDPVEELTEWEASLKGFVSNQIAEGNNSIDELFPSGSSNSSKWFSSWKSQLDDYCQAKGWYDPASYKGVYANIGAQIFLLIGGVIAALWAGIVGLISIALILIMAIASAGIPRRSREGERTYQRWKAYRRGLKQAENHETANDLLDQHAIYAVAFGLSEDRIEALISQADPSTAFIWFVMYSSASTHSVADMAEAFSSLSATGTTAFPGAVSAGSGGASAGAAGGGAAGGAG